MRFSMGQWCRRRSPTAVSVRAPGPESAAGALAPGLALEGPAPARVAARARLKMADKNILVFFMEAVFEDGPVVGVEGLLEVLGELAALPGLEEEAAAQALGRLHARGLGVGQEGLGRGGQEARQGPLVQRQGPPARQEEVGVAVGAEAPDLGENGLQRLEHQLPVLAEGMDQEYPVLLQPLPGQLEILLGVAGGRAGHVRAREVGADEVVLLGR